MPRRFSFSSESTSCSDAARASAAATVLEARRNREPVPSLPSAVGAM